MNNNKPDCDHCGVELTLGDHFQQVVCYITNFSIDIDTEVPWEISAGQRAPKYCNVTIELAYVGADIPQQGSKFFGLGTFRGQDVRGNAAGASDQLPDENGKTTFVVNTMDYGFLPSQETVEKMHEWNDCACHNPNVVAVDFETGEVVSDES